MSHLSTHPVTRLCLAALLSLLVLFSAACDHAKDLVEQGKKQAEDLQKSMEGKKNETAANSTSVPESSNSSETPVPTAPSTLPGGNGGTAVAPPTPGVATSKDYGQLIENFMKITPALKSDDLLRELGSFPEEYRGRLTECDLSDSKVTDVGLMELAKFPNLISVNVSNCQMLGNDCLVGIKDLAHLESLRMDGSQVSDASLAHLSKLPHLKVLGLGGTKITDAGIAKLPELPQLEELYLTNNSMDGSGFRKAKLGSTLRILDAGGTSFGIAGITGLSAQRNLEVVDLTRAQVSDKTVGHLKGLGKLRVLKLNHNPLSDKGVKQLTGLSSLQELMLGGTQITDDCLTALKSCKNLRYLYVRFTSVTDGGAEYVRKISPDCQVARGS